MIITKLELSNFRNYGFSEFEFDENTNILYGDNAQGKTNVLEAIYVAGTTKSHKSSKDKEMIQMGFSEAHIKMYMTKKEISHRIDIHLKKSGAKGVAIDGVTTRKSSDLIGLCNIIFFSPEDLNIIKNGPAETAGPFTKILFQCVQSCLHFVRCCRNCPNSCSCCIEDCA